MKKYFVIFAVGLGVIISAWFTALKYSKGNFDEPGLGTYRSDEMIFLKTYYLVEKGWNYYPAFSWAIEGDVRRIVLTSDVFQWRMPTLFYLWRVLANDGWQVSFIFWICVMTTLTTIFLMVRKLAGWLAACMAVLLLVPYFMDAFTYQTSFLFTEWWSWFFLIWGLAAFTHQKRLMAYGLWLMAVIIRELLVIPLLVFFVVSLIQKRYRLGFLITLLFFGLFMWLHRGTVIHYMQGVELSRASLLTRFHGFDKQSFMPMLAFSMRKYPLIQYKSNWLLLVLAALSFGKFLWRRKFDSKLTYLYVAGWSLFFTLPFISTNSYNDYWGILFMPILIATIPFLWKRDLT